MTSKLTIFQPISLKTSEPPSKDGTTSLCPLSVNIGNLYQRENTIYLLLDVRPYKVTYLEKYPDWLDNMFYLDFMIVQNLIKVSYCCSPEDFSKEFMPIGNI